MKQKYEKPRAEKLEFDYTDIVVASKNPAQCTGHNPGHGCGTPDEVTEGRSPGNCSQDEERKNKKFGCF